jgi:ATP-dependent RNA helicase DeaD
LALGAVKIHCHVCFNSADILEDRMRLKKGSQIVVGAPNCIQQFITQGVLSTSSIRVVVVDRMDEIFSRGFGGAVEEIFRSIPRGAQVVFFLSETFTELKDMTRKFMRSPVFISHVTEKPELKDTKTPSGSTRPPEVKSCEIEVRRDQE